MSNGNKCTICGEQTQIKIADLCSNMKIMGNNFPAEKSVVVYCPKCGFVYSSFKDTKQSHFDEYYMYNSRTVKYEDVFGELTPQYLEHVYDIISKYVATEGNVIDIAGGYGEIAEYLVSKGYSSLTMTEIKADCIESVRAKGIRVIEKNVYDLKAVNEKYDIAVVSHDLEHFTDVSGAVENIMSVVRDDGYVFIEVPDATQYVELNRTPYHFLTYEHVCHFSDITLKNIAVKYGMEILELGHYIKCNDYPCVYVVMKKSDAYKDIQKDEASADKIRKYVEKCEVEIKDILNNYKEKKTPLILWGIGASTTQLLNGNFDDCNVIQLIDTNPSKHGLEFDIGDKSLKIEAPDAVVDLDAVILILPIAYKRSIEKDIVSRGLKNKIESL